MNSSTKTYEPIHGFDISFLPKVNQFQFDLIIYFFIKNSYIIQKQMMENERYYILFFKKLIKIMKIY